MLAFVRAAVPAVTLQTRIAAWDARNLLAEPRFLLINSFKELAGRTCPYFSLVKWAWWNAWDARGPFSRASFISTPLSSISKRIVPSDFCSPPALSPDFSPSRWGQMDLVQQFYCLGYLIRLSKDYYSWRASWRSKREMARNGSAPTVGIKPR